MSKFTKGPWESHYYTHHKKPFQFWIHTPEVKGCSAVVAKISAEQNPDRANADAHLIAAAPDMYDFIKDISRMSSCGMGDAESDINALAEDAKLVLKKAEGKE